MSEATKITKMRTPPTIVFRGNREVISTGQFNVDLVSEKMVRDGVNEWVPISDISRFVYGNPYKANNVRVRSRLWTLRRALLTRGHFMIHVGRPTDNVKIFVGGDDERRIAGPILAQMRKRREFSAELYERAMMLLGAR